MYDEEGVSESVRLTNADFRRLLMTPRVAPKDAVPSASADDTVRGEEAKVPQTPQINKQKSEQRKKKKKQYANIKKEEEDRLAELAQKYRDRAQERREGKNQDETEEALKNASAYRAVAPDLKSGMNAAEIKRRMIDESKYLGGDLDHTHLVKGLDYALLRKVRSEIEEKERLQELEMDKLVMAKAREKAEEKPDGNKVVFRTAMARNLFETVAMMKSKVVKRNELFAPGRMAYVVELEDEVEDNEIPTILIRSKADVPVVDNNSTLSTNDIVINKLTQILSYLRQGIKTGKKSRKVKDGRFDHHEHFGSANIVPKAEPSDMSIYDDIGDYVPTLTKAAPSTSSFGAKKTAPYFVKPDEEIPDKAHSAPRMPNISNLAAIADAKTETDRGLGLASVSDSYAECFPGQIETNDALYDSDEEVDYTKMDTGGKKGLLSRFDFDTTEEYSNYMSKREAMPKAAYQYGVKMEDGRRTQRSNNKPKNDKAKFDKEWQKIQNILFKRKGDSSDGGSNFKVPRNN